MGSIDDDIKIRAALVSRAIEELLPITNPEQLYRAGRHLVDAGGKRLRPSLLLIAAEAVGADARSLVPAAVSIELIHNFTLIHDDIMDNAELRRGRQAVHVRWGLSGAILAGDTLYSKAFQILGSIKGVPSERVLRAMEVLSSTCTAICEGQWMDLEFERVEKVDEEEYLKMIEKKTGVLYGASASMGAILGGASIEVVRGLFEFGRLTGMGFQIHDDVLDLTVTEEVLGKKLGGDLLEGKKTLIIIQAGRQGLKLKSFGRGQAPRSVILEDIRQLEEAGCIEYARNRAAELVAEGKRALQVLPESSSRDQLLHLADYMIKRGY